MFEYFECEVKINIKDEPSVTKLFLRLLPRVGEHLGIETKNGHLRFKVTDIWHWASDKAKNQKVIIYVNHATMINYDLK